MIPLFKVFMANTVIEPLVEVLSSGYIGEGEEVKRFEQRLIPWVGNLNVLTTNSGTSAIQLALRLAGAEPGAEIITTPMTCSATNEPIMAAGAKIVWADIDPWTGNIDPEDVERKLTPKTRAILCVDWGGYPCDFTELNQIARKEGIKLIEDACHAFGSTYENSLIGSHCDYSCFSFQAIKNLTTVDGGALTCRNTTDYNKAKLLRWYGIDRDVKTKDLRCEADIEDWGYKFHMNDVAATIGIENLKYVRKNIETAQMNAATYDDALPEKIRLKYKKDRQSCYWLYTIRVPNRDAFIDYMRANGIQTSKVHVRNDRYTMFREFQTDLPGVDEFYNSHVCIPVGWWVYDIHKIINKILAWPKE